MATLVLGSIGTALGGPLGGAIGSLIGQSIDQRIFGPGSRRGPRLEDLRVQTSSYGTAIPRVYGAMRVAGSVIWATELKESSTQTGAKGQPDTTVYNYSVSLAVALSSRPVHAIGRIWADGKLLRGEAGDFKVSTTFRFYNGSEDQEVDPLIASLEGIGGAPAYRGLALAVFEDLQLAEYGNRIPFLTFELLADREPPQITALLEDASGGAVLCSDARTIGGYAAHGSSIRAAIEPLVEQFGVQLLDDGGVIRSPTGSAIAVTLKQLGNSSDDKAKAAVERAIAPAQTIPTALTLAYYDPARDYQLGQMRATAGEGGGPAVSVDLPAALQAGDAKALAQARLARLWTERDTMRLRLPSEHLSCAPGTKIELAGDPLSWTVTRCVVEGLVPIVELRANGEAGADLPAHPGRVLPSPDLIAGETYLALFDLPSLDEAPVAGPILYLAAATDGPQQTKRPLELDVGGVVTSVVPSRRPSLLGKANAALGPGQAHILDELSAMDVEMFSDAAWLESCDEAGLAAGFNLAVIGKEIVQFGRADPLGARVFRISRLLRGRRGTEWAMDRHSPGEDFALLVPGTLQPISLQTATLGATATARTVDGLRTASTIVSGEALRPPSPVRLAATLQPSGGLLLNWMRRSRTGWAWVDEMDAPLGESRELYRVRLSGAAGEVEHEVGEATIAITAADVSSIGQGTVTVQVQQIGDVGVSRPAIISFSLT